MVSMMKVKNVNLKNGQKGLTLIEIAIVVAIGALLLFGLVGVPRILKNNKVKDEIGELSTIASNVQGIYSIRANFAGVTLTEIIAQKGLPDERVTSPTTAANRWGGAITMVPATLNSANDAMAMTTAAVPEYECIKSVSGAESTFRRIAVAGTDVKANGGQLNLTTLGTQCTGGADIIYYFSK